MQQLTAMDAVFLSMETPDTPAHIGGLGILDPSTNPDFGYNRFVEMLESRLEVCPRFMWTVQEVPLGLDRPYWVERDDVSVRDLVHRVAVPSPGGAQELSELTGLLFSRPLDRDRPLWEIYFIEGLQGGRVAMLWKVHHCLMDGASGAGLAELLFDLQPEPADRPLVAADDKASAGPPATLAEMAAGAVRNGLQLPAVQAKHIGRALGAAFDGLTKPSGDEEPATAPPVSFNGAIGPRRSVAWSTVSLTDAKAAKNALDVKLNDVVLAITGGAVRRYLADRDELPTDSLYASVPVSMREKGDKSLGNQVSQMSVYWGTDLEDPVERVRSIHAAANTAKSDMRAGRHVDPIAIMAEAVVPGALSLFMRGASIASDSMPLPANAVVSNVPMTPMPVYIAGAEVVGVAPISLLAPTQGLNITVISYNGELHFGITADSDLLPEPWAVAGAIPKAMIELLEALGGRALEVGS